MFEEYQLSNRRKEENAVLPDMLRVGSFTHRSANIPVFLPFSKSKGFCFVTDNDSDPKAIQQMQYMALELLLSMDLDLLDIKFVDVGLNTRYPMLSSIKSQRLTFINSHERLIQEMNAVIERARYISTQCLGYQYEDLNDYNQKNPDIREPYTVLFISCFPRDFDNKLFSDLSLLIREGGRCGIRIIMNISRNETLSSPYLSETALPYHPRGNSSYMSDEKKEVLHDINRLIKIDCTDPHHALSLCGIPIYNRFSMKYGFSFDSYSSGVIASILSSLSEPKHVGQEITDFLSIPIGKSGRNVVNLEMGLKSGIYHGFIAGQSGSGKTNLLHNIITSIAQLYSPDELRLYLLDYKWGVEFQVYENHPNVEFLLLDNENVESGVELLKELRKEFVSRSREFLSLGKTVNSIDEYNRRSKRRMPHILVIIDEVQQLFSSFSLRREVNPILKEIAKQGRAFGIHLLFSTQSYAQCEIDSDTLSQMPLRIAFSLSSGTECRAIFGPDNDAPMSLPPYSAIYNCRNGDKRFNTIVKMDYFDKSNIEFLLQSAERKHKGYAPFRKRIIREKGHEQSDVSDISNNKSSRPSGKVVSRPEYDGIDFEKEFGF